MQSIDSRTAGFAQVTLDKVTRGGASYAATERFIHRGLKLCVWTYRRLESMDQTARLLRDTIDFLLRRYHNYCIKENIGAHYREVGLKVKDKTDFEHVIPAAIIRELLIHGCITVDEAMNPPTCTLSRKNHKMLNSKKESASQTPDLKYFWKRYQQTINVKIETHDGVTVDMNTWTWAKHCEYFGVK